MRPIIISSFVAAWLCFVVTPEVGGQTQSREYIESTSPLPGGGWVTSRSEPGRGIQTVITMPDGARLDDPRSVLDQNSQVNRETALRQNDPGVTSSNIGVPQMAAEPRYLYPTNNRVAQSLVLHPPIRATAVAPQQVAWQTPTLGLGHTVTTQRALGLPNCNCAPQTFQRVPVFQGATFQVAPPASQVPSLAIQDPNQAALFNSGAVGQAPAFASPAPQFSANQQNGFWSPLTTGSGVYQPLIRLSNMPPGTYLGQGIIGQPTAYVDGQPVRNLLRYVFP